MTPAIVVIAYNRPDSLKRLLGSLDKAVYPEGADPTLIISLDKCDVPDTKKVANDFSWTHGEKRVIERPERMGLKKHVLACGDFAKEYGSIIVLEDDLFVSPAFYEYSAKALDFTEGDGRIGGVSLYNHLFNVHVRETFCALDDGYDNWYFQLASSWGQAYTAAQWENFIIWYENKEKDDSWNLKDNPFIPANVSGWSDKSWLKYYIAYLIETDKYFLYPRISYTTNFGDVGSHMEKKDTDLQVPFSLNTKSLYLQFSSLDASDSVYDAFFENVKQEQKLGTDFARCLVDLYGIKPVEKMLDATGDKKSYGYVISSRKLPYGILKSYGRQMRPHDANVIYEIPGDDFYLYDLSCPENGQNKNTKESKSSSDKQVEKWFYQYRGISAGQMTEMIKYRIREKLFKQS